MAMTDPPPASHRSPLWTALLALLGVSLASLLPIRAVLRARNDRRAAELSTRLRAEVSRASGPRWERPVLRGDAVPGNAATAHFEAVRALGALPSDRVRAAFDGYRQGQPVPPDVAQDLAARAGALRALRESTQRAWAWTSIDATRGASATFPAYRDSLVAAKMLLLQAEAAAPGECLRVAADVARLGQDLAPGASLIGLMIADAHPAFAEAGVARCAPRASAAERLEAAREFAALALHAPPAAPALANDFTLTAVSAFDVAASEPFLPRNREELGRIVERGDALDLVDALLTYASRLRAVPAGEHHAALAATRAVLATPPPRGSSLLAVAMPDHERFLARDAEARWRLAALAVALRALAGGDAPGFPTLADPATGAALGAEENASGVTVRGAGADGRAGTGDDPTLTLAR